MPPITPKSECRVPKKCDVKDCHNGFITRYLSGSIDSEKCPCSCHVLTEQVGEASGVCSKYQTATDPFCHVCFPKNNPTPPVSKDWQREFRAEFGYWSEHELFIQKLLDEQEPHLTADQQCCACDYDLTIFEEKITNEVAYAITEERKRLREKRGEIEKILWKHYNPGRSINAERITDEIMALLDDK